MINESEIKLLHLSLFVWGEDENLTKAHIRYLEGALIVLAGQSNAVELLNSANSGAKLPESDQAEMALLSKSVFRKSTSIIAAAFIG